MKRIENVYSNEEAMRFKQELQNVRETNTNVSGDIKDILDGWIFALQKYTHPREKIVEIEQGLNRYHPMYQDDLETIFYACLSKALQ